MVAIVELYLLKAKMPWECRVSKVLNKLFVVSDSIGNLLCLPVVSDLHSVHLYILNQRIYFIII